MKLNVITIKDSEIYNKEYERFVKDPQAFPRPDYNAVVLPHNIADWLIVAYKVFIDQYDNRVIGVYTTLETMDFFMTPFDENTIKELDQIIDDHNFNFVEPSLRFESELESGENQWFNVIKEKENKD